MKKIAFLISSLTIGGAEKLTLTIAEELANDKNFSVFIIVLKNKIDLKASKNIKILTVNSRFNIFRTLIFIVNQLINNDIEYLYSVMERANFINYILSLFYKKYKPLYSIHSTPSVSFKNRILVKRIFINMLYKHFLSKDKIITVSNGIKQELKDMYNLSNIQVIYNPVDIEKINKLSEELVDDIYFSNKCFNIVAVGRLVKHKGFHRLIIAMSELVKENSNVCLYIIGDGDLKNELNDLINKLKLDKNVSIIGFKNNPYKYMKNCDVFILSSLWEGFGIVIAEAMSLGLPVISSNCKFGPSEILDDGKYGILYNIENMETCKKEIVRSLRFFMENKIAIDEYSKKSKSRSLQFSIKKIADEYEKIFE